MPRLKIEGSTNLRGTTAVSGAKNAALPIMVSSLLTESPLVLSNVPDLDDVKVIQGILSSLGVSIFQTNDKNQQLTTLQASNVVRSDNLENLTKMRAGILMLGPLGCRLGEITLPLPGGDPIGARPIGFHLEGLEKMGANVKLQGNQVAIQITKGLCGIEYEFPRVSVGASEALIMTACLAKGITILRNVAKEPEVEDLITVLRKMGAVIYATGYRELHIEGCDGLLPSPAHHQIISDRIECGSYVMASAACPDSNIFLKNTSLEILGSALTETLQAMGVELVDEDGGIRVSRSKSLEATSILTAPWPGFATDLQAQLTTLCTQARGESSIEETIFEDRFQQLQILRGMGATIHHQANRVIVEGPTPLKATDHAIARDIRASFSLVIAGLIAEGTTTIFDEGHLRRGYEKLDQKLIELGADLCWCD